MEKLITSRETLELKALESKARLCGEDVYEICRPILEDERFPIWSGSSKPEQHHYGKGGLIKHTLEVVETCFRVKSLYEHTYEFDSKEVFLAAFFHDVGKMWDYEPVMNQTVHDTTNRDYVREETDYSKWKSSDHKRLIHHISRSALVWSECCRRYDKNYSLHDKVLHAILAHHTCREAGSPVAPKTRVAWLLTLCDNISARLNDCDTWDVLDRRR